MVFFHRIHISDRQNVYEETLELIKHFPFAERKKEKIHGIKTICLVDTKEHEFVYGCSNEKPKIGWETEGDMNTLKTAEQYFLPRDLIVDNEVNEAAGDAMLGECPTYLDYNRNDERFSNVYNLW